MNYKTIAKTISLAAMIAAAPIRADGMFESLTDKVEKEYKGKKIDCQYFFTEDSTEAKVMVYVVNKTRYGELSNIKRFDREYAYNGHKWILTDSYLVKTYDSAWACVKDGLSNWLNSLTK